MRKQANATNTNTNTNTNATPAPAPAQHYGAAPTVANGPVLCYGRQCGNTLGASVANATIVGLLPPASVAQLVRPSVGTFNAVRTYLWPQLVATVANGGTVAGAINAVLAAHHAGNTLGRGGVALTRGQMAHRVATQLVWYACHGGMQLAPGATAQTLASYVASVK